jgi:hypothetical protein
MGRGRDRVVSKGMKLARWSEVEKDERDGQDKTSRLPAAGYDAEKAQGAGDRTPARRIRWARPGRALRWPGDGEGQRPAQVDGATVPAEQIGEGVRAALRAVTPGTVHGLNEHRFTCPAEGDP